MRWLDRAAVVPAGVSWVLFGDPEPTDFVPVSQVEEAKQLFRIFRARRRLRRTWRKRAPEGRRGCSRLRVPEKRLSPPGNGSSVTKNETFRVKRCSTFWAKRKGRFGGETENRLSPLPSDFSLYKKRKQKPKGRKKKLFSSLPSTLSSSNIECRPPRFEKRGAHLCCIFPWS